ncbi:MAG TPA: alkaline phosphatase family protein [Sporichthyaceae bacterium]|nr:alkaline phosphatase family protein [Sporichthyaceae bacterium]
MVGLTRRRLLQSAGLAASAFAAEFLPPNVSRALAVGAPRGGRLSDVKHVVIHMQENRSFDHYFGTLAGVRGFTDPAAPTLSTGRSVFHQPDPNNPLSFLLPFHMDSRTTNAQAVPTLSHSWEAQHSSWNGGRMDNFVAAHYLTDGEKGPFTMGYFDREDIPVHFALAENFTICDNYHCSVLGPTWPNRLYMWSATIDPDGRNGGPITSNVANPPYTWKTYPEALTEAGVSWRVYQEVDNYGLNMLELFASFQDAPPSSPLFRNGLRTYPAGQFEYDARNDRLPTVSWIVPTGHQSEHPDYTPAAGADFVASKVNAIAANPDVWAKTVYVLNYDENDGFFDHVLPPTPRPGTPGEFVGELPIGAGFRVPCIIVSPWTTGGWVAGQRFDHTSTLQFLERVTGVPVPNLTAWRRATFGDLTSAFGLTAQQFPGLPSAKRWLADAVRAVNDLPAPQIPGAHQVLPLQEGGS